MLVGCSREAQPSPAPANLAPAASALTEPLAGGPSPTILLAKAQFEYVTDSAGRRTPRPGPAKLVLLRHTENGWQESRIEDPDSRVFHKAIPAALHHERGEILTIAGTSAALKSWHWDGAAWSQRTLWQPTFGGQWDRLRDVELADVTGDGRVDIVLATHDEGVVAVLERTADGWVPGELDRAPRTYVHEIELADVDGDGTLEIFATPSHPNRADLVSQGGAIVMYRRSGETFTRSVVEEFPDTHVKEILTAAVEEGAGPSLFAAVEALTRTVGQSLRIIRPVEIRRYRYDSGAWSQEVIATLDDQQCRFLAAGDVDADGAIDLVASAMRSGVWLLRRTADGSWQKLLIDGASTGFEHAMTLCDLDTDGRLEVIVAADPEKELARYVWEGGGFRKEVLAVLSDTEITFGLACGSF